MFVCSYGATSPIKHTRKENAHMAQKKQEDLLSIFGAKVSQDGKKVVITLVGGENENKKYYNTCVKLNNQQKTHAKIDGDYVLVKIPMLKEKVEIDENEELPF